MGSRDSVELYAFVIFSFYKYLVWWWPIQAETSSQHWNSKIKIKLCQTEYIFHSISIPYRCAPSIYNLKPSTVSHNIQSLYWR